MTKVLVVDDDPDVLCAMSLRLGASGYETVQAADGAAALSAALRENPDVILLDLGLPGGDGFTVIEKLKASPELDTIPIIVVTARDPVNNLPQAYRAGAAAFFQKPFNNDLLLAVVGGICSKANSRTTKKILIVDDDADHRRGLNIRLRAANYERVFAEDAASAISIAQKERPNLIILDLGLPGGNGLQVLFRLKSNPALANIPVIVLTGQDPVNNKSQAFKAGAQAFFQKPADNAELDETIRQLLRVKTG